MFKIDRPGIYFDVPAADYFADPAPMPSLTQSVAKVLLEQSPLHAMYEHPRLRPAVEADDEAPEKYVAAQAIGNAAHAALIGRGKTLAVAEFDNWKKDDAKKFRAEAEKNGLTPILRKHANTAHEIVLQARLQLSKAGWDDAFREGNGEVVVCWQEQGIWFRTMLDWLSLDGRTATDLKTSGASFAPHALARKMVDDGWDIQAAMHERALDAIDPDGAGRRRFRFAALENYPPYALVPVELSETWLTMGRKKLAMAVTLWRQAIMSGNWPGYPQEPVRPDYPAFKEAEWLGREIEHNDRPQNILMAG